MSRRTKHNALLDCELLREVYINLIGAKEPKFSFLNEQNEVEKNIGKCSTSVIASFHPAFLMRQPDQKKMAWIDLKMIRQKIKESKIQIVGMRYFNVYGPNEAHKGHMASVAYHLHQQLEKGVEVKLFEGSDGYEAGEQRRDFVYVDDVIKVNLWFMKNPEISGIFNVGTGKSQTFNEVANSVINYHGKGLGTNIVKECISFVFGELKMKKFLFLMDGHLHLIQR